MRVLFLLALFLAATPLARAQAPDTPIAPELSGLGTLHMPVTTAVARAQLFFDQGLRLLYAFNHPESLRAFREAARLDPNMAMAHWGQAMAVGPNLNAPLTPENNALALQAVARAQALKARAGERDRALVDAIAARFSADPKADRQAMNVAYAEAMGKAAGRFAADPDVQTLYADAVMNVSPWDYWEKDGRAKPGPALAIATLERVIAAHPNHAGALHYHIHAIEASNTPERAEASADRLGPLMPAAGHMVHMPAHIYLRVGRYREAAEANERAIAADEDYLAQCQAQGLYPVSYYPHNLHFLWAAATLEGRSAAAIDAARQTAAKVPHHHAGALAWTADFPVTPMLAYARFGKWRDALTEPKPPANQPYAIGIWHYMRALAFSARRDETRAAAELAALKVVMTHEAFKTTLKDLPMLTNLEIAARMAEGEMRARAGRIDDAVRVLTEAVALEDAIPYNEPPVWHHPPRQVLGAVLLEAGRAREAERVYTGDLARFRENGWSLFGLMKSLEAQHRGAEAAAVRVRFDKAWERSDVTLTSSRVREEEGRAIVKTMALATGVTLEYVEQGHPSGTPVILLHGITDSWRSFEPVLPHLPAGIRAFAISLRGHGGSDRPTAGYAMRDFARDVDAFMAAAGLRDAVVVGHSMSTGVALQFAVDFPARTRGLVLVGGTANWRANAAASELAPAFAALEDPVDPQFARDFQLSTVATSVPEIIDVATRESLRVPARVWKAALAGLRDTNFMADLCCLTVPTIVIWGDKETVVTRAEQDAMVAELAGARLVVFEGAGHAVHWDQPARAAAVLAAFVIDVSRPAHHRASNRGHHGADDTPEDDAPRSGARAEHR